MCQTPRDNNELTKNPHIMRLPVISPPNTNKNESTVCQGELAVQMNFFYLSVRKLRCENVFGEVIICRFRFTAVVVLPILEDLCLQQAVLSLDLGKFAVRQQ